MRAGERTDLTGVAGAISVAFGNGGIGVGIDVVSITKNTKAWIGNGATVDAKNNIKVEAISEEDVVSVSAAIAAGNSTGLAGGIGISVFDIDTHASIENATVKADGSVLVSAQENCELDMGSGTAAYGGSTGAGGAIDIPVFIQDTQA